MVLIRKPQNIALAALVAVLFVWNAFSANVMEQFVHMNGFAAVFGSVSRWLSMTGFVILPAALLYGEERCKALSYCAVLPFTLLGVCFSGNYFSVHRAAPFEIVSYALSNAAILAACVYLFFFEERPKAGAVYVKALPLLGLIALGVAPLNLLMQFPALMHAEPFMFHRFGVWHILFIFLLIGATIAAYYYLRGKDRETRRMALFLVSAALFFQLSVRFSFVRLQDYQDSHGIVGALPLYVCSFGIMLLPFGIMSRSRFFQSVLFLINTPGAIIAFVWPSAGPVTIFHYNVTYFTVSHILLFVTTAHLTISLKYAPQRRDFAHLSYMIALYYVAMAVFNALAVRYGHGYDPNFSFVSASPLPIPFHLILPLHIAGISISPIYMGILYAVQYSLCTVTYGIYKLFARAAGRGRKPPAQREHISMQGKNESAAR